MNKLRDFYCRLDGAKRDSLGSDVKNPIESDTDSMAEYGDGDTGKSSLHCYFEHLLRMK